MNFISFSAFLIAFVAISKISAYPNQDSVYFPEEYNLDDEYSTDETNIFNRQRRSFQASGGGIRQRSQGGWQVKPSVRGDERGNTHAGVGVSHTGPRHEVNAQISKVVKGQDKGKKTWHVGGVHRFRRSFAPGAPSLPSLPQKTGGWQVSPSARGDERGNVHATVGVKHTGPKHEVNAHVSKIVKGQDKGRKTWHVGGVHRFRRSFAPGAPNFPLPPQQTGGWKVSPGVSGDEAGNTRASLDVSHTGPKHQVNAGISRVIKGPAKARPTWHVGGAYNW